MRVAVVAVGDEILAGDVVNTNATWLAKRLAERGASVERMLVIPDDRETIADTLREYSAGYDAVVVTGGLGPTHDDLTMDGVAAAFDVSVGEHPDAVSYFDDHETYDRADLTDGTTHLPDGARMLPNPDGVAPGAVVGNVYVLPGVPDEMKGMFDLVADEFSGTVRHVEFVYAAEPESALIDRLAALRERFGVTVGSYPGDHVRVKLQGTDRETVEAAADWLRDRVEAATVDEADRK